AGLKKIAGAKIAFRPADGHIVPVSAKKAPAGHIRLSGTIRHREFLGAIVRYAIAAGDQEVQIDAPFKAGEAFIAPGSEVAIDIPIDVLIGLDA
ncbi:MAG: TOBE domain-containing protein, partial [Parvibaculaceae bacterium]